MVFDEDNVKAALIAYALTRVAPLVDEAIESADSGETGDQPSQPEEPVIISSQLGLVVQVERTISLCQAAVANYLDAYKLDRYRSAAALENAQRLAESLISRTDHLRNLLEPMIRQSPDSEDLLCIPQTQLTTTPGRYRRDTHIDWYFPQHQRGQPSLTKSTRKLGRPDRHPILLRLWITDQGVGIGVVFPRGDAYAQEALRWNLRKVVPDGFNWERCLGRQWQESPWHIVGFNGQLFLSHWYRADSELLENVEAEFPVLVEASLAVIKAHQNG
jgi:hypothetical protein